MENEQKELTALDFFMIDIEKLYDEISMDKKMKIIVAFERAKKVYEEELVVANAQHFDKGYEIGYETALNAVDSIINKVAKIKQNEP